MKQVYICDNVSLLTESFIYYFCLCQVIEEMFRETVHQENENIKQIYVYPTNFMKWNPREAESHSPSQEITWIFVEHEVSLPCLQDPGHWTLSYAR
jgi:hypothetical protein